MKRGTGQRRVGRLLTAATAAVAVAAATACEPAGGPVRPVATVSPPPPAVSMPQAAPPPAAEAPAPPVEPQAAPPEPRALPTGYGAEMIVSDLEQPAGMAFDGAGNLAVVEQRGGQPPRLSLLVPGARQIVAAGDALARWEGLAHAGGDFYLVETTEAGSRLLRLPGQGAPARIAFEPPPGPRTRLAAPTTGPDGAVYFALAGEGDCRAILAGTAVEAAATGDLCSAIVRIRPGEERPELVATGAGRPMAMAFAPDGTLYLSERPGASGAVAGTILRMRAPVPGLDAEDPQPGALRPIIVVRGHAISGFDFATADEFGGPATAFIAEPEAGRVLTANMDTGEVRVFINRRLGLAHPVATLFDPVGRHLYVLDAGDADTAGGIWRIDADAVPAEAEAAAGAAAAGAALAPQTAEAPPIGLWAH